MITQSRLKELLHYDPETGVFTWHVSVGNIKAGAVAGGIKSHGYWRIRIHGKDFMAHRLAWLYVHGVWPKDQIDHRNGTRDDNRLINLREATRSENHQNRAKRSDNSSGFIGVGWHRASQKWRSRIYIGGGVKHLGLFDTPEAAHSAYLAAKANLHTFQPTIRAA